MKKKEDIMKVDIREILLDDDNTAPIYLYNDGGERIEFEQIAVIPMGEELYCILKPITKVPGIKDDEAVVFKVEDNEFGESYLRVEDNEETAIKVFCAYYDLVSEDFD